MFGDVRNNMIDTNVRYIVENNISSPVIKVSIDNKDYLVNPAYLVKYYNEILYTKENAKYKIFIQRVLSGTPIKNFKSSKYYKMYLERAKKENPEILF